MLFHLPRSTSPHMGPAFWPAVLPHSPAPLGPNSDHLSPETKALHLLGLAGGQVLSQPGVPPRLLQYSAGLPSHPASRGQQAPDHKDPLLAGALVNVQRLRNWHSAWSDLQFTLGKGTTEDGAPLFLATAGLQPRKENSFSGHICPFVAPPLLHIKTPGTPTALV